MDNTLTSFLSFNSSKKILPLPTKQTNVTKEYNITWKTSRKERKAWIQVKREKAKQHAAALAAANWNREEERNGCLTEHFFKSCLMEFSCRNPFTGGDLCFGGGLCAFSNSTSTCACPENTFPDNFYYRIPNCSVSRNTGLVFFILSSVCAILSSKAKS